MNVSFSPCAASPLPSNQLLFTIKNEDLIVGYTDGKSKHLVFHFRFTNDDISRLDYVKIANEIVKIVPELEEMLLSPEVRNEAAKLFSN